MSVIRAFIAIDISSEIQEKLEELSGQLRERLEGLPIRWVPVENIHVTLKFLGNVSLSNLEMLEKILAAEAGVHPPFEISAGELGAFPSERRPRVLWVGVQAPAELNALQSGIENQTTRLGYAEERRPFSPHLTLGRVSRNAKSRHTRQISQVLRDFEVGYLGAARIRAVHLYKSDLQPGGAVYTRMFSAELSGS